MEDTFRTGARKRNRHGSIDSVNATDDGQGISELGLGVGLEVVGRHALFFDDDAAAAFVNSREALVPLNSNESVLIDRYDVRHLVSEEQLLSLRRRPFGSIHKEEEEIDFERYRDLHHYASDEDSGGDQIQGSSKRQKSVCDYQNVPYSYGSEETVMDTKTTEDSEGVTGYKPPFPLPDNLLCHLPPTEKSHQIIARTAKFVSEHGGQSEIVLRVKQGSNPVFGFLMPDHNLYKYYRYLVENPDVLDSGKESNNQQKEIGATRSEGLSLLGSVYGSGDEEDEEAMQQSLVADKLDVTLQQDSIIEDTCNTKKTMESCHSDGNNDILPKPSSVFAKNLAAGFPSECTKANASYSDESSKETPVSTTASHGQADRDTEMILEPPSFLKSVIEKMVEFISRNGKEFEAIIVNQDRTAGRFPFLLPSNPYHKYYLKELEAAQQGKLLDKDSDLEKPSKNTHSKEMEKTRQGKSKSDGDSSRRSSGKIVTNHEKGPLDLEKKGKLQLVFGSSKKDANDNRALKPISLETAALAVQAATRKHSGIQIGLKGTQEVKDENKEGGVSVDAAAAIVMAATRGIRKPSQNGLPESTNSKEGLRERLLRNCLDETNSNKHAVSSSNGVAYQELSNILTNWNNKVGSGKCLSPDIPAISGSDVKLDDAKNSHDDTAAKQIVKAAMNAASNEADSSEAYMSREEKIKAERLKRARLFAALLKNEEQDAGHSDNPSTTGPTVSIQNESKAPSNLPKGRVSDSSIRENDSSHTVAPDIAKDHRTSSRLKHLREERDRRRHHHHHHRKHSRSDHASREDESDDSSRKHKYDSQRKHKHSKEDRDHRSRHRESESRRSPDPEHKKHKHGHHSKSRDRDSVRKHENRGLNQSNSHKSRDSSLVSGQESALKINSAADTEATGPSSSTGTTEVPDDLRAKVRAMLLANM